MAELRLAEGPAKLFEAVREPLRVARTLFPGVLFLYLTPTTRRPLST